VTQITDHLDRVRKRVRNALSAAGRGPDEAIILAVSKQQPASTIEALFQAGQRDFGENYIQDAIEKMDYLNELDLSWHFIGQIQSNKTRIIAERFHWVHTIDRLKIATRLNEQRPAHTPPLDVCIQVNQAGEQQKGGVEESEVSDLAHSLMELPALRLRGLMTIPPHSPRPRSTTSFFERLKALKERLVEEGVPLDTRSMGMSADMDAAITHGATIVRIGTAIFGPRHSGQD
jgi:pyridoxal phosphate enzyme (YggS family)